MTSRASTVLAAVVLGGSALGQTLFSENFDGGSNEGDYQIWFSNPNTIEVTGGNPGAYLEFDNLVGGLPACQYLDVYPNAWPNAFSGDYRRQIVTSVGIDVNVLEMGAFGGEWRIILTSDPDTPDNPTDDCSVELVFDQPPLAPPLTTGWHSYDFPIDVQSLLLPVNGDISGACVGMDSHAVWNNVIQEVDRLEFRMDTVPGIFGCFFFRWRFGVDNIRVDSNPPPVGTSYCTSVPTSAGTLPRITASGSTSVADQNLRITASGLPPGANGIIYYGTAPAALPFGDGFRCVTGATQRLPFNSASGFGVLREPDVFAHPMPNLPIAPGTLYFQAWFRDAPAMLSGFSLSDGLEITFLP